MNVTNGCGSFRFVFHNETSYPMIHNFRDRSSVESDHGCSASHSLDHHEAEWLRPVDGHKKSHRLAQELCLLGFADLSLHLDGSTVDHRLDYIGEIVLVLLIDFRCNLQRDSSLTRNSDRPLRSLIWSYTSEKCKIIWFRWLWLQKVHRQPVIDRRYKVGVRQEGALIIRDRDQRRVREQTEKCCYFTRI